MGNTLKIDCSGLVCPMPVAKTKKMLNKMNSGDILEVFVDFFEAGENIKRFAEGHGGKILEFNSEGPTYHMKIEKL